MMQKEDIPPAVPDGGMAQPTMLIGSSMTCDARYKWFQAIGRYLDVPYYAFDMLTPPAGNDRRKDVRDQYIGYQVQQYRGLIEFMERVTGWRMNWDRLDEYVDIALETWRVWRTAYEFRRAVPCPMGTEDAENIFVPAFLQEGEPRVLDFYKDLYDELKYRAENGIGVIPSEKYRLIWGPGLPPWHTMKIFNYFGELGAVFVYEMMYEAPYIGDIPKVSDPLERMAWRQYLWYVERNKHSVVGGYNFITGGNPLEFIEPFKADGVVFHWLRSCRSSTVGQLYYRNLIQEHSGVPCLMLESDMCDVRDYIETEWNDKIKAFLETVEVHKEGRREKG
jgi:benzoyl-CoA reductase/2-hydroxyglutaryl-CoA dehydratase subunit BcrC/BadD/HgdB